MKRNKKGEVFVVWAVLMTAVFCGMSYARAHQAGRTVDTIENPANDGFKHESPVGLNEE